MIMKKMIITGVSISQDFSNLVRPPFTISLSLDIDVKSTGDFSEYIDGELSPLAGSLNVEKLLLGILNGDIQLSAK